MTSDCLTEDKRVVFLNILLRNRNKCCNIHGQFQAKFQDEIHLWELLSSHVHPFWCSSFSFPPSLLPWPLTFFYLPLKFPVISFCSLGFPSTCIPTMLFLSCLPSPKVATLLIQSIPLPLAINSWIWLIHNKLRTNEYLFAFCKHLVNRNKSSVDGISNPRRKLTRIPSAVERRVWSLNHSIYVATKEIQMV